jgi:hypothetical protein
VLTGTSLYHQGLDANPLLHFYVANDSGEETPPTVIDSIRVDEITSGPSLPAVGADLTFFDDFSGAASNLSGRVVTAASGTRIWMGNMGANSYQVTGTGKVTVPSSVDVISATTSNVLLSDTASAFFIEVIFASVHQLADVVTAVGFALYSPSSGNLGVSVVPNPGNSNLQIQMHGGDVGNYDMPIPAENNPLTVRVEFSGGVGTLKINGTTVHTDTITYGTLVGPSIGLQMYSDVNPAETTSAMLIDSIEVGVLPGTWN